MRAGVIELADVVVGERRVPEYLPQRRDAVATHVQKSGTERRTEPFVQAAGVVVAAAEIGDREVELAERMRAVDHHLHAARMRHLDDPAHRQDLPGDVDHVADHEQARLRRDRFLVDVDDFVIGSRMHRHGDNAIDDAVPPRLQLEHVEHRTVVLLGHHRLVAGFPVEAVDDRVERLGRVARDDQLRVRATEQARKLVTRELRRPPASCA